MILPKGKPVRMKTAAAAFLLLAVAIPAHAGLRATIRIEVRKAADTPGQQNAGQQERMAGIAASFVEMLFPGGSVDMDWLAQDDAVRTEFRGRTMLLPEGGIVLARAGDPVSRVIVPASQTYFTVQATTTGPVLPGNGTLRWQGPPPVRSGIFETIAGHRAEKVTISWRMKVPVPEGRTLPAGMPDSITMSGEVWCTDDFKDVAFSRAVLPGTQILAMMGVDVTGCPLPLRSSFEVSVLPGYQLLTTVTSITEEKLSPELFRIPEGYREVPAPLPQFPK